MLFRSPESLDTWELYHRGLWHFFKYTQADNRLALEFMHKAAARDPGNAAVHAALGMIYRLGGRLFAPLVLAQWNASSLEHGRIAVGLDPLDAMAHAVFGFGLQRSGEHEAAVRETAQAVALNPSNATVRGMHALVLAYSGRPAESLPHFSQAIRLSPFDPLRWLWVHGSSIAYYFLGDYEASATVGRETCRMRPNAAFGYRAMLVALAELGRIDEARQVADVLHSKFNNEMRTFLTTRGSEFRETDHAAFVASLAKGGLALRDGVPIRVN